MGKAHRERHFVQIIDHLLEKFDDEASVNFLRPANRRRHGFRQGSETGRLRRTSFRAADVDQYRRRSCCLNALIRRLLRHQVHCPQTLCSSMAS